MKGIRIQSQFLIFMEKSNPYAKITISPKTFCFKTQFQILYRPFIFIVIIMYVTNTD